MADSPLHVREIGGDPDLVTLDLDPAHEAGEADQHVLHGHRRALAVTDVHDVEDDRLLALQLQGRAAVGDPHLGLRLLDGLHYEIAVPALHHAQRDAPARLGTPPVAAHAVTFSTSSRWSRTAGHASRTRVTAAAGSTPATGANTATSSRAVRASSSQERSHSPMTDRLCSAWSGSSRHSFTRACVQPRLRFRSAAASARLTGVAPPPATGPPRPRISS